MLRIVSVQYHDKRLVNAPAVILGDPPDLFQKLPPYHKNIMTVTFKPQPNTDSAGGNGIMWIFILVRRTHRILVRRTHRILKLCLHKLGPGSLAPLRIPDALFALLCGWMRTTLAQRYLSRTLNIQSGHFWFGLLVFCPLWQSKIGMTPNLELFENGI